MREPTDAEIVAAAKAISRFEGETWDRLDQRFKWLWLECAYAALRAAQAERKK